MIGLGTIINTAAVIGGGILGLLFGSRLKQNVQDILTCACGVSTLFLGISGAMQKMLVINVADGSIETYGGMMAIICMALGGLIGELLRIEDRFEQFGVWLKKKTKSENDGGFVDAFLTATFTVCIGAMTIVGSIQDGIYGDYSTLAAKSVLDFLIVMAFCASLGKGAIFSAIPVFVFQGGITVLARFIEPLMTEAALTNLSLLGSMLIFCVGINLVWGKKVKVANLLPAVFLAVAWAFIL